MVKIGPIEIVESIESHADYLYPRLREMDKREIWLQDANPAEVLHCPLQHNHNTLTALYDSQPMCMFGTVGIDDSNDAIVWALGSNLIDEKKKSFYKASLQVVNILQSDYTKIWNVVPCDHLQTIAWLKKLNFQISNQYFSLKNVPMLYFSRCNNQKSMSRVH